MGLIGWVLLGGKFRCRGWSGVIARGRGPKLRLKGDANQVWEMGGPPPPSLAQRGGDRAPTFRERQEDCGAAWAEGAANVGFMSRGGTDRGLSRVSLGQICPGSFLG